MQNQMLTFENPEFGKLEVLTLDGKPYFPATECAELLGYARPRNAIDRHCKGALKRGVLTNGGTQEKTYIPEGDLYRLIIRSKLPAAVRFEAFVCDEVLPSIRNSGAYITPATLEKMRRDKTFTDTLIQRLSAECAQNNVLIECIDELLPKALYYDTVLQSPHAMPVSVIAKDYGMTAVAFNKLLHSLGVHYRIRGVWLLYKRYHGKGYTISKTCQVGGKEVYVHTCWTELGRRFLYELLKWYGILPTAERVIDLGV